MGLLAASYGSVEDIEILWTLIAVTGLSFSIWNLREVRADRTSLRLEGISNGRERIATTAVRSEIARVIKQTIFLLIGILAMFIDTPPQNLSTPWYITALSFLFRWGLITASALTAYQAYLSYRLRKELLD